MESSRLFRLSPRGESGGGAHAPQTTLSGRRRKGDDKPTTVSVVDTMEDLKRVFYLRTCASLGGKQGAEATEIDATDFGATHLLAWSAGTPVGCIRLRVEGDQALVDRFVIRSRARGRVADDLIDAAIELGRRMGASTIICDESVASQFPIDSDRLPVENVPWKGEVEVDLLSELAAARLPGT